METGVVAAAVRARQRQLPRPAGAGPDRLTRAAARVDAQRAAEAAAFGELAAQATEEIAAGVALTGPIVGAQRRGDEQRIVLLRSALAGVGHSAVIDAVAQLDVAAAERIGAPARQITIARLIQV